MKSSISRRFPLSVSATSASRPGAPAGVAGSERTCVCRTTLHNPGSEYKHLFGKILDTNTRSWFDGPHGEQTYGGRPAGAGPRGEARLMAIAPLPDPERLDALTATRPPLRLLPSPGGRSR